MRRGIYIAANKDTSKILANLRGVNKQSNQGGDALKGSVLASGELLKMLTFLEENQADLTADLTSYKRGYTRTISTIEGRCSSLQRSLEIGERELNQLQREFAIVRDTSDTDTHRLGIVESHLEALESQLNQTTQGVSLLGKEVEKIKRRRLTTTHILIGVLALTVALNSVIYVVSSSSDNSRLVRIERVLQLYLQQ